jgi:putative oxidoreductase
MNRFLRTEASLTLAAQRAVLGLVLLPHGLQKTAGWFGGYGFDGTMQFFTGAMHVPAPLAVLVILGESLGALALAFGLFSRLTAFGIAASMVGAVLMVHLGNGFFMNWAGNQPGEGFEYHLLALALSLPLVVKGGGAWSLDRSIARWLEARRGEHPSSASPRPAAA